VFFERQIRHVVQVRKEGKVVPYMGFGDAAGQGLPKS